jgi:hypothetical protein
VAADFGGTEEHAANPIEVRITQKIRRPCIVEGLFAAAHFNTFRLP